MKILILSASMNEPGNSDYLADRFAEAVRDAGADVEKIRLEDVPLEHFSLKFYEKDTDQGEHFRMLEQKIRVADGLVIATPVWNFSMPAQLKNLIDRMGSFALDETRLRGTLGAKPFFLLVTGGSSAAAWHGLMKKTMSALPEALKYFHMTHIGTHFEPKCTVGKGVFGLVVDTRPASMRTVREKAKTFAGIVRTFAETGTLPTGTGMYVRLYRFGQKLYARIAK